MGQARALIVLVAATGVASADPTLRVSVPPNVLGDGRTVVPVSVTGNPPASGKALPVPDPAMIACGNAIVFAATANGVPAVLAPAVTAKTTLDCTARVRASETKFRLDVSPPLAGLYARAQQAVRATAPSVDLDAFVWDGKRRAPPAALRAAASDANVQLAGGKLRLVLAGKAPRTVAVALADGERVGAAFVPMIGVTELPVESSPLAKVEVWVAGTWFGPVTTVGKIANVPIEVPPGVTHGVARSTDTNGYVTDVVVDLKVPVRPRIAAVASSPRVSAGATTMIAVALLGKDTRPAAASAKVEATAERGTLDAPRSLGGGLWAFRYVAPRETGRERVTIHGDGEQAVVEIDVVGGAATRIELDVTPGPHEPGSELVGRVRVLDADNNVLARPAVRVTLGGAAAQIADTAFRVRIPTEIPDTGFMQLEAVLGTLRKQLAVPLGGKPVRASISADGAGASIVVEDRFGNLVHAGTFEVAVTGGTLRGVTREQDAFRATIDTPGSSVRVIVRAGNAVLADDEIRFRASTQLGAWASGGWMNNLGALASPRASIGLGFARPVGSVELALLVGAEAMSSSTTMDAATSSVLAIAVPVLVRARFAIASRFGLALAGGIAPVWVKTTIEPIGGVSDEYRGTVLGVRGHVSGDAQLGPGRVFLNAGYGYTNLSEGPVRGKIDGIAIAAGYEWWLAAW